jgi:hypothetical protein
MWDSVRPAGPGMITQRSRMKKAPRFVAVLAEVALGVLLVLLLPLALIIVGLPVVLVVRALLAVVGL